MTTFVVSAAEQGQRLDRFLACRTGHSRRQLTALIEHALVQVNGKTVKKGARLDQGQVVEVLDWSLSKKDDPVLSGDVEIVFESNEFLAVNKPAGLHTEEHFASQSISLEGLLPVLFPGQKLILLNRLDRLTSGIVLLARSIQAERQYKELQKQGQVRKIYLARIEGQLSRSCLVKQKIMGKGRRVKVLDMEDDDSLRWSWIRPLGQNSVDGQGVVLVGILRGARHQIRAHLSYLGCPIVGDPLYGQSGQRMYLHHAWLDFADVMISCQPSWAECPELRDEYRSGLWEISG